jgi:methyl-accepting chemotaxis protein
MILVLAVDTDETVQSIEAVSIAIEELAKGATNQV